MNKTIRRYGWLAFAGLIAVTLLLPVKARVQESPQGTVLLPPPPDHQKDLNPKLDFALQRMTDIYAAEGIEKVREYAAQHKIDMKGDLIRVIAEADSGESWKRRTSGQSLHRLRRDRSSRRPSRDVLRESHPAPGSPGDYPGYRPAARGQVLETSPQGFPDDLDERRRCEDGCRHLAGRLSL